MQHDVEQGAANLQPSVVVNEAQLPEAIHEKRNSRSRGTYDLGQRFVAYLGEHRFQSFVFTETSKQQKSPGQALAQKAIFNISREHRDDQQCAILNRQGRGFAAR